MNGLLSACERRQGTLWSWGVSLGGVIVLRHLFEGMFISGMLGLSPNPAESFIRFFLHYPLNYLCGAFMIILVLRFFSREQIGKVASAVLSFFWVILLCPTVDALWLRGGTYPLGYFHSVADLGRAVVFFFCPGVVLETASPGVRAEIFVITVMAAVYTWEKTKSWWKTALAAAGVYLGILIIVGGLPVLFLYAGSFPWSTALPGKDLIRGLGIRHSVFATAESLYALLYLFLFVGLLSAYYIRFSRQKMIALLKNTRPFRTAHFFLLTLLGMGYAWELFPGRPPWPPVNLFVFPALAVAVFFIAQSAAVFNDIADLEGDRISNITRPLVQSVFHEQEYRDLGVLFLLLGLGAAVCVSYFTFLMLLTFWLVYFLYSCSPFRLKKIFPVNVACVAANGLVMFLAGISVYAGTSSFSFLSKEVVLLILVPFLLGINFITLKDIEADRISGVRTLPVIMGERKGKRCVAVLSWLAFFLPGIILGIYWLLLPGAVFGMAAAWTVLRKKWDERIFFGNYFLYFLIVIVAYWYTTIRGL